MDCKETWKILSMRLNLIYIIINRKSMIQSETDLIVNKLFSTLHRAMYLRVRVYFSILCSMSQIWSFEWVNFGFVI